MNTDRRCPNCGEELLRTWEELTPEDQEVVRRLPASADYPAKERERMHQWCRRCWHESAGDEIQI